MHLQVRFLVEAFGFVVDAEPWDSLRSHKALRADDLWHAKAEGPTTGPKFVLVS